MNFSFTEVQSMLRDSITKFVQDEYAFSVREKLAKTDLGFSVDNWQTFAELGWLSIPFAEEQGGFGGSVVDSMVLMEEFGKGLVLEPFIATVLLFGGALNHCGNRELMNSLIPSIIDGSLQGSVACFERQSRFDLSDVATKASKNAGSYILSGEKVIVYNGASADKIIVSARTSSDQFNDDGITLFLVDANASGIEKTSYRMMDGQMVANITFDNVAIEAVISTVGEGLTLLQKVVDETIVAVGGETMGVMEKLHSTTVEYSKTRKQFGVAIGSFQVLQHRMVDMFMACEQTRSLLYRAACSVTEDKDDAAKDVLALKTMIGRAGKLVGDHALQIHGGIGMTDELDVGHYVKRLMMINSFFGDADYSQQKFAELSLSGLS